MRIFAMRCLIVSIFSLMIPMSESWACPNGAHGTAEPNCTVCARTGDGVEYCTEADARGHFNLSGDDPGCLPGGELYFFCSDCPDAGKVVDWSPQEPIDLTCPQICGTRGAGPCPRDEFCDFHPASDCGANDLGGICQPRPQDCDQQADPVCGCDGQTYTNECVANAAGVSVKAKIPGTRCPCPTPGPELVVNGTFEAGNSGFVSDAVPRATAQKDSYTITTEASTFHPLFAGIGNGQFLVLDSPAGPNNDATAPVAWQAAAPIQVTRNNRYCISLRLMNVNNDGDATATVEIRIDGQAVSNPIAVDAPAGTWITSSTSWTPTSTGRVTLQIVALGTHPTGHDFAIDDISLTACCSCFPDPDPSFTLSQPKCDAGSVQVSANQVRTGIDHQWNYVEIDANGEPTGDWSAPCWGPNCQFTLEGGKCYQIRHGIWSGCFTWTEERQELCIPKVVNFGDCCDDPELVRRIQCKPGEVFFKDECGCGCKVSSIRVTAEPEVGFGCDRFNAMGTQVTLTIEGGQAPFTCKGPGELVPTSDERQCVFKGMQPGVRTYTVIDDNGDTATVDVEVEPLFELSTTTTNPTDPGCNNGRAGVGITGGGQPPYTYRWSDADQQITPTATGLGPGTYEVLVTDDNGCYDTASVTLFCEIGPPINDGSSIHLRTVYLSVSGGGLLDPGGGGFGREVSFDDGWGLDLAFERFVSPHLSFEAGVLYAELDVETVFLEGGDFPLAVEQSSEELLAFRAGANFHLFPRGRKDLYFGPFVSFLDFPDPLGLEADDSFGLGAILGLDAPLGSSPWQLSGALRYIDTEIELTPRRGGLEETLDFDLLTIELGVSKKF